MEFEQFWHSLYSATPFWWDFWCRIMVFQHIKKTCFSNTPNLLSSSPKFLPKLVWGFLERFHYCSWVGDIFTTSQYFLHFNTFAKDWNCVKFLRFFVSLTSSTKLSKKIFFCKILASFIKISSLWSIICFFFFIFRFLKVFFLHLSSFKYNKFQ